LDKDVYSDKRVVDYLTEHYYVVKLNAEDTASVTYKDKKSTKPQFAGAFGVKGYPTIIFFDSKGDPITSLPGYVDADKFLTIAKFIGEDYYKSMSWENYQKMNEPKNPKE
jgi:thioredoxin-related protein